MIDLVFAAPALAELRGHLRHERLESAGMLLALPIWLPNKGGWRLLIKEIYIVSEDGYLERTGTNVRIDPRFELEIEKKARQKGYSIVYCHTHPNQAGLPLFSSIDDEMEKRLADYLRSRIPGVPHVALLCGSERVSARELGTSKMARIIEVGKDVYFAFDPAEDVPLEEMHHRQIRVFGKEGQQRLHRLRVAVVGLGGTGSVVVQQLAHLGVDNYLLLDRDIIDKTNLNRVPGALLSDVKKTPKVEVGRRVIQALRPGARVDAVKADVNDAGVGRLLTETDFIFCCTDSHASRHLINHMAYQYLIPTIDMGVAIDQQEGGQISIWGHDKMLAPGLPCLWCVQSLNPRRVREELMEEMQRNADPYFNQSGVVQPSVISLTSAVASFAITMFLSAVTAIPAHARHLVYDAGRGRTRAVTSSPQAKCSFCSPKAIGNGDLHPMPERAYT